MVADGQEKLQFHRSFWWSNLVSCERVAIGPLKSQFYLTVVFGDRTSFRAKELRLDPWNNFTLFWRWNLISCEEVARYDLDITILPQFLAVEPRFVRKGWAGRLASRNFTALFGDRARFVRKGWAGRLASRNFTTVFGDRTSFRAKGLRQTSWNHNFTSVFGGRTSFRAKGLRFVPSCWHCPCPRLQERNRKEGEGKRARGEDVRMRRCEDEKMRRCEDEKIRTWEDEKMRRW